MHQLERLLDHLGGVADHIEQAQRVRLLGADRHQPRCLPSATGHLVEHREVGQRPLAVGAFDLAWEQAPFQLLAADRRTATGGEFPLDFGGQAHEAHATILGLATTATDR